MAENIDYWWIHTKGLIAIKLRPKNRIRVRRINKEIRIQELGIGKLKISQESIILIRIVWIDCVREARISLQTIRIKLCIPWQHFLPWRHIQN